MVDRAIPPATYHFGTETVSMSEIRPLLVKLLAGDGGRVTVAADAPKQAAAVSQ